MNTQHMPSDTPAAASTDDAKCQGLLKAAMPRRFGSGMSPTRQQQQQPSISSSASFAQQQMAGAGGDL